MITHGPACCNGDLAEGVAELKAKIAVAEPSAIFRLLALEMRMRRMLTLIVSKTTHLLADLDDELGDRVDPDLSARIAEARKLLECGASLLLELLPPARPDNAA